MQKLKGLWIPAEILLNKDLSDKEKIILSMILYLSDERENCFASNQYIASIVNVTSNRVSKIISSLKDKEYVKVKLKYKTDSKEIEERQITPIVENTNRYSQKLQEGIDNNNYSGSEKQPYPIGENNKDIINNIKNKNSYNKESHNRKNNKANFENTKKVLDNIKLELPDVPDINDIKIIKLNREKVEDEIIKPKNKLINDLYQDNKLLYKELSKQVNLVDKAIKYEKERKRIMYDNEKLHNEVDKIKSDYKKKEFDLEWEYKSQIKGLEKENKHLHKVVDKFKETIDKFIKWICQKFDMGAENNLIRDFERETRTCLDAEKQIKTEEKEKEWELER